MINQLKRRKENNLNILILTVQKTEVESVQLGYTYNAYMVRCHENANSPKNLSLFAFNIESY